MRGWVGRVEWDVGVCVAHGFGLGCLIAPVCNGHAMIGIGMGMVAPWQGTREGMALGGTHCG